MANLWIGQIQAISNNINRLLGKIAVLNASDVRINPATEETLALIKSTDGIKKITDAVQVTTVKPDGTNTQPSMDALIRPGFQKLVAPDSAELSVRYGDSLAKLSGFANMLYNATAARWDLPAGMPSDQLTWDASGMYGSPALFVTTRMFGWDSVASLNRVAAVQPANGAKTTATNVAVVQNIDLNGNVVGDSITYTEYNVAIVAGATEYPQALPANTRKYQFRSRGINDIRFAFTTGKVATSVSPFQTLPAGGVMPDSEINMTSKTIYFAGTAGDVVEIIVWT